MNDDGLIILGCGFVGRQVTRLALQRDIPVIATVRQAEHISEVLALGAQEVACAPTIDPQWFAQRVASHRQVLVTYPPDPASDEALAAVAALAGASVVYISSTAVYGAIRGRVDETTAAVPNEERGRKRLAAEDTWSGANAIVLRAPAIYGPGRGLHLRIARGEHQLPDSGDNHISRIHAHDLARLCLAAFERGTPGTRYVVGDLAPCSQREISQWISERLGKPLAQGVPLSEVSPTLRNDRKVDPAWALERLGAGLTYPTYREGYEDCIQRDGLGAA